MPETARERPTTKTSRLPPRTKEVKDPENTKATTSVRAPRVVSDRGAKELIRGSHARRRRSAHWDAAQRTRAPVSASAGRRAYGSTTTMPGRETHNGSHVGPYTLAT